ncbi:hypothetical protein FRC14_004237 [Serendipita sp. 396]|nr:hypothetical protein FRC14_004237 [Serendipita sp. 396]KAG8793445.1 hypothetical protein FRC16_010951 [Serendipita sp. 398]
MASTSVIAHGHDDPLTRAIMPPAGESAEERASRTQEEALARQRSHEIDEQLKKGHKDKKELVKILLLGQAESGKSTTLKNMKLVYAKESFSKERAYWKPIIHFNILKHVLLIIRLLEEAIEAQPEDDASRSSTPAEEESALLSREGFTTEHRILCMQLKPLIDLEASMRKQLLQHRELRNGEEIFVQSHFAWAKHFYSGQHRSQQQRLSKGDALRTEMGTVLNASCRNITALWSDPKVRKLLDEQALRLEHEAGFFLDELERVTELNYEPTDLDVCKARLRTVGVTETHFRVSSMLSQVDWIVYDVGGARTQRATWKPYFDDANAIVFLAPLSGFNQKLEEEPRINRLEDSLLLWRDISSSPLLTSVHLILFLNKVDLLQKKLEQGIEFGSYFKHYAGGNDVEAVCKYMKKKFVAVYKDAQTKITTATTHAKSSPPPRLVRIFLTSVLDIQSTAQIIVQVQNSILSDALNRTDLL